MKKSNRIKLIANPGAGDPTEEASKIKFVADYLKKNGLKVDVALAKPKEEATKLAKRASKKGYKVVAAMGGDGTIEAVVRGLVGSKTRLAIIPAGTAGNVAKSLGIPEKLEESCDLLISNHSQKLDVAQLKTRKGKKFYFLEIATVGLAAAVYPDMNKAADGKLSNLKDAALTFFNQETKPKIYLTMNNESKVALDSMLVMVSNTPLTGANFLVAPDASVKDGLLDISIFPDFSKPELLRYFAEVMNQRYSGDKKVQHYQARSIKIKTSPKLDIMADGIMLGKGKIKIKILPGGLRVITDLGNAPQKGVPQEEEVPLNKQGPEAITQDKHEDVAIKVG
jgi:YegS/Rv2252/BmrU family lipid kinase